MLALWITLFWIQYKALPPPQTFVATAYNLRGKTTSGHPTGPGVCAVDPRVVKLGSRVYVHGVGWFVAHDTGRKIRGRKLDLWMSRQRTCRLWGRRSVQVHIYPPTRKAAKKEGRKRWSCS